MRPMSLAQHVTQEEGFDYEGHATTVARRQEEYALTKPDEDRIIVCVVECDSRGEPVPVHADIKAQPAWRHMSFDPADPPCEERHIAAYNVTNARRLGKHKYASVFVERRNRVDDVMPQLKFSPASSPAGSPRV